MDISYYKETWQGNFDGEEDELKILLSRATDIINNKIFLSNYTVDTVPERMQEAVYKAVCSQVDFISNLGGIDCLTDNSFSSVALGKFNYSLGSGGGDDTSSPNSLCLSATNYLLPTGLLYVGSVVV